MVEEFYIKEEQEMKATIIGTTLLKKIPGYLTANERSWVFSMIYELGSVTEIKSTMRGWEIVTTAKAPFHVGIIVDAIESTIQEATNHG